MYGNEVCYKFSQWLTCWLKNSIDKENDFKLRPVPLNQLMATFHFNSAMQYFNRTVKRIHRRQGPVGDNRPGFWWIAICMRTIKRLVYCVMWSSERTANNWFLDHIRRFTTMLEPGNLLSIRRKCASLEIKNYVRKFGTFYGGSNASHPPRHQSSDWIESGAIVRAIQSGYCSMIDFDIQIGDLTTAKPPGNENANLILPRNWWIWNLIWMHPRAVQFESQIMTFIS